MDYKPAIPSLVLIPGDSKNDYGTLYSTAVAYAHSGFLISEEGKAIDRPELSFPAVVCSSFAAELFLKFFILLEQSEGTPPSKTRVHTLGELLDKISPARQKIIAGMHRNSGPEPHLESADFRMELFKASLSGIGAAPFVAWRYVHEINSPTLMSHAAIADVVDTLERAAKYCLRVKNSENKKDKKQVAGSRKIEAPHPDKSEILETREKNLYRTAGSLSFISGNHPILIGRDSPLRRIPSNLDPKLAMFFDGIRYTVEFLDVTYERLYEALTKIANHTSSPEIRSDFPRIFSDAWTYAHSVKRFYYLYRNIPGITTAPPSPKTERIKKDFLQFEELCKISGNVAEEADRILVEDGNFIGELNWLTGIEVIPEVIAWHCTIRPGTFHKEPSQSEVPIISTLRWPTDGIKLSLGNKQANLSEIREHISEIIVHLEKQLADAFSKPECGGIAIANDFFGKRSVKMVTKK